jgi:hypothetical protein
MCTIAQARCSASGCPPCRTRSSPNSAMKMGAISNPFRSRVRRASVRESTNSHQVVAAAPPTGLVTPRASENWRNLAGRNGFFLGTLSGPSGMAERAPSLYGRRPAVLALPIEMPGGDSTTEVWAGGEMPLLLPRSPGHGKLRIPRSCRPLGSGTPPAGDFHRRPLFGSTPRAIPEGGSNRRPSLGQGIESQPDSRFLRRSFLFPQGYSPWVKRCRM